ncbi:MAG TPA: hypothetical protein QF753_06115 [Victivallales bacterium]|nr:hypothetical protein [Victivallales bacterium]
MVVIVSYSLAVIMCVVTMICWGSWGNTQKLVSGKNWSFQLYYWDFTIGLFILTLILAFTIGSFGHLGHQFIPNLEQASTGALFSAFVGGVIFNAGNILIAIAIDIAGMAFAFPVGVGFALVIGVISNYIPNPIGNPFLLFLGVGLVVLAIVLSALAHRKVQSAAIKENKIVKGLIVALLGGILIGIFFRFLMNSIGTVDFTKLIPGDLSPYTAIVLYGLGILISSFIFNTLNMYKPITGKKCTYADYFKKGSILTHLVGMCGGLLCGLGTSCILLASAAAGPSISYGLGQGATLIAAVWGVFIWKEFKNGPKGTNKILIFMFLGFLMGLALIIISRIV